MNTTPEVVRAANALTSWVSGIATAIKDLAKDVASLLECNLAGKSKVNQAALTGLDGIARSFLIKNAIAVGAGAFFAAASVEDGGQAFEWWSRKESGALGRLDFDRTPGSDRYYDYEHLPYFTTAASTGEQTVWGPYIDYLGADEYIMTFTAPFSINGQFAGVAGCDIRLTDLERLIMPNLLGIPGDAALVNASNRVILGNSGMYLVGERIKSDSPAQHRRVLDVPHLGLCLVYSNRPSTS
jgi:hypothetical protein